MDESSTLSDLSGLSSHITRKRWMPSEELDACHLSWTAFHERYPARTYAAWAMKRAEMRERAQAPSSSASSASSATPVPPTDDPLEEISAIIRHEIKYAAPGIPLVAEQDEPASVKTAPLLRFHDFECPDSLADDELTQSFLEWQTTRNKHLNEALEHSVEVPIVGDAPIAIAFPSDWHIGNAGTDHKRLIEDVNLITAHPRMYCALGGDPIDNFIIEKMMNASRTQLAQVDVQWRIFRHLVRQLVDTNSLLFVGAGNHDAWTHRVAGIDGITVALRGLPVINTGEGGFVDVSVGKQHYGIYRKHKPTRFTSGYNPTHFLKQMLRMGTPWDFDIGVSEHIHTPGIEIGEHRPGTGRLRVFITCGSYKIKDPYAEGLGYYGSTYGVPCVLLWPDRHEMLPVMSIEQAIKLLDTY